MASLEIAMWSWIVDVTFWRLNLPRLTLP